MNCLCNNCKRILCNKMTDNKKRCKDYYPIMNEEDIQLITELVIKNMQRSYFEGFEDGHLNWSKDEY